MKISHVHVDFYIFLEKMVNVVFQGLTLSSNEGAAASAFKEDICYPLYPSLSFPIIAPRGTDKQFLFIFLSLFFS